MAGKDVFMQTADGKYVITKVFLDLETSAAYQEIIEGCEVDTEEMPEEAAGVGKSDCRKSGLEFRQGEYSIWKTYEERVICSRGMISKNVAHKPNSLLQVSQDLIKKPQIKQKTAKYYPIITSFYYNEMSTALYKP